MRAARALSSNGTPCGSNRANLRNCIAERVMTKQRRVYGLGGSSLVDLRSRVGRPSLYLRTVAFSNAKVSRSKLNADAKPLLWARARRMPPQSSCANARRQLQIISRTSRAFAFGEIAESPEFIVTLLQQIIDGHFHDAQQILTKRGAEICRR